jgi:ABC-2 type transport system ATP-binding protein
MSAFENRATIMQRARFAFAPPALFEGLTAFEHLHFLSGLRSSTMARVTHVDIERTLEWVGLEDRAQEPVRAFSFGMRQRLVLAQALLPRPELIVLDEPTDGLDPIAVLELREILFRLREESGLAILLSNHLLIEIEELVDRMLVLIEGRTVYEGTPAEMVVDRRRLRLTVSDTERACVALRDGGHEPVIVSEGPWIEVSPGALTLAEAARLCAAAGVKLIGFHEHVPRLEEALLERLGRAWQEVR